MKKVLIILLMMLMMTGCFNNESEQVLFVKKDKKYAMCVDGELKTKYEFNSYEAVGNHGFVVHNGKKDSYLSNSGEEVIAYKKGISLTALENMVIACDEDENYTIYDSKGKVLYKSNDKIKISVYGLPVIYKDKQYQLLDGDGEVFLESQKKIYYASIYNTNFIVACYKDSTVIYDTSADSTIDEEGLNIDLNGQFDLIDQNYDQGYLLRDQEEQKLVFVNKEGKVKFNIDRDIDSATISGETVFAKKDDDTYIISLDGKTNVKATSYYYSSEKYLVKNDSYVYGPHQFVNGKKTNDVTGIQLNPKVSKVNGSIFPVYVQSKGYSYYNFSGTQKIKTYFKSAGDFTKDGVAIVSKDGETYYLIDKDGQKISEKYKSIEYIGNGYFAGYETSTKYAIIDATGKQVIDDYFMGESEIYVFDNETYGLFNKSGTTHVYNMNELEEEFTLSGEYKVYQERYLVSTDYKNYYDMNGKEIYKR